MKLSSTEAVIDEDKVEVDIHEAERFIQNSISE
jgi:hypothetical protein